MADETTRAQLLAELATEGPALLALLQHTNAERMHAVHRADGWSAFEIAAHLADANYGLALMALGELKPTLPLNPHTNWMDVDQLNEDRRRQNAALPYDKLLSRSSNALATLRRAIEQVPDLNAPGPYGQAHSLEHWLRVAVVHTHEHRREIEQLLAG